MNKEFRKTLKFLRKANHYSQKEFAKKANMSHSSYNRIENGSRIIGYDDLSIFLKILNIDYFDFFSCLIQLEVDSTLTTLNYQTILKESKRDEPNLNKINKSFDYFKKKINSLEQDKYPINTILTSYIQLSFLFPKELQQISSNEMNNIANDILQKNYWTPTDFFVIAIMTPNLNAKNVDTITKKTLMINPLTYTMNNHKYIHSLLQNLIDYYLVNFTFYENELNQSNLKNLLNYWYECLEIFNDMEAKIIYNHMQDMFKFLYALENKDNIKKRCDKRVKGLTFLGINTLKEAIENESDNYYNGKFGKLHCVITDTSNNINQNLFLNE
ncbi:helix-turn-helix transcriptional regulator [Vagococcus fluvialis]|uniref:Helix-turn-helix transcriptional regulator n=1 Tax=Vagococcus fluvialis TaxID=2738 RepID=A0A7X6I3F2_9ENTE|nr:helix-turn-helix transcriptional regulator [Vagococcus fluvialis]NKC68471.1 helix-turn-helix transcriptional regulator [Vagococcus fluvialis]